MKSIAAAAATSLLLLAAAPPPAPQEVYGHWVIEQARSAPILDKRRARRCWGRDGRLSGHNSCNAMSASFTLDGAKIAIGTIATTRMACPELQREQEDCILSALELAATARACDDGLLEIRDAEGHGLLPATRAPTEQRCAGARPPTSSMSRWPPGWRPSWFAHDLLRGKGPSSPRHLDEAVWLHRLPCGARSRPAA